MAGKSEQNRIRCRWLPEKRVVRSGVKNGLRLSKDRVFTEPARIPAVQGLLCLRAVGDAASDTTSEGSQCRNLIL
jgi:hypothetical protein